MSETAPNIEIVIPLPKTNVAPFDLNLCREKLAEGLSITVYSHSVTVNISADDRTWVNKTVYDCPGDPSQYPQRHFYDKKCQMQRDKDLEGYLMIEFDCYGRPSNTISIDAIDVALKQLHEFSTVPAKTSVVGYYMRWFTPRTRRAKVDANELKASLFDWLWSRRRSEEMMILPEISLRIGVQNSQAIADMLVFTGDEVVGYEIKSKNDTFARLQKQVDVYMRYCDRVFLVLDESHVDKITDIDDRVGIISAKGDKLQLLKEASPLTPEQLHLQIRSKEWKSAISRMKGYSRLSERECADLIYEELEGMGREALHRFAAAVLRKRFRSEWEKRLGHYLEGDQEAAFKKRGTNASFQGCGETDAFAILPLSPAELAKKADEKFPKKPKWKRKSSSFELMVQAHREEVRRKNQS